MESSSFTESLDSAVKEAQEHIDPSTFESKLYEKLPAASIRPALRHARKAHRIMVKLEKCRKQRKKSGKRGLPKFVFDQNGGSFLSSITRSSNTILGISDDDKSLRSTGTLGSVRSRGGRKKRRHHFGLSDDLAEAASVGNQGTYTTSYRKNARDPPTAMLPRGLQFGTPRIVNQSSYVPPPRKQKSAGSVAKVPTRSLTLPELQQASLLKGPRDDHDDDFEDTEDKPTNPLSDRHLGRNANSRFWGDDADDEGGAFLGYEEHVRLYANSRSGRKSLFFQTGVLVAILVVIVAMACVVIKSGSSTSNSSPISTATNTRLIPPRPSPSVSENIGSFSSVGTGATTWTPESIENAIKRKSTSEAWKDLSTPQGQAFNWLGKDVQEEEINEKTLLQRYGLATFYYSTQLEPWDKHDNWATSSHECTWFGIVCAIDEDSNPVVVYLGLKNNNIHGNLPPELGLLSELAHLDLTENYIEGSIPPELFASLGDLHTLYLAENFIEGGLPDTIGQMVSLENLDLSNNSLKGTVPGSISGANHLVDLRLASNEIGGQLPDSIASLAKLKVLHLGNNEFTGAIPDSITRMGSILALLLFENDFDGAIPEVTSNSLELLHLDENALTGKIPRISAPNTLREIRFGNNELSSSIPAQLGENIKLEKLWLQHNQLEGKVPHELGRLEVLQSLRLEGNRLTDEVPEAVCDLRTMYQLTSFQATCDGSNPSLKCSCCDSCHSPLFPTNSGLRGRRLI